MLLQSTLGAAVRDLGTALTGSCVGTAGARLHVVLVGSSFIGSLRLHVVILAGTGAPAARLGPHVHFTFSSHRRRGN